MGFPNPANNSVVKDHLKKLIYLEGDMFLNEEQLSQQNPKGGISLEEFLKVICLQYDEKERPQKFEKNHQCMIYSLRLLKKINFLKMISLILKQNYLQKFIQRFNY